MNLFTQATNVILMRPHNWECFSFEMWLRNAVPRLHRSKLVTVLANKPARILWMRSNPRGEGRARAVSNHEASVCGHDYMP